MKRVGREIKQKWEAGETRRLKSATRDCNVCERNTIDSFRGNHLEQRISRADLILRSFLCSDPQPVVDPGDDPCLSTIDRQARDDERDLKWKGLSRGTRMHNARWKGREGEDGGLTDYPDKGWFIYLVYHPR